MTPAERIEEINGFLAFVGMQWPLLRPGVAARLSSRCSRCIVSENFAPLRGGVCEACHASVPPGPRAAAEHSPAEDGLAAIFAEHCGRGSGNYDAVVLFSGGKDSAYLLHRLQTQFPGLRIAALTVDNGFMSHVALQNCRDMFYKLENIDHFVVRPKKDLYARAFRHALTHLDGHGCYEKVDRMDGDLTFDVGRHFAAELAAPLLVSGMSPEQVEGIFGLASFESPPETEAVPRTRSADFELAQLYDQQELSRYWWNPGRWPKERRPRVLHPFHAWQYDEEFILKEVVRLGLIDVGRDNPLATNNDTIPVMLAVDSVNLGYSSFEPEFAQLVRQGRADRAMWLALFECVEYLSARGEFLPRCISATLARLDLTARQVGLPEQRTD